MDLTEAQWSAVELYIPARERRSRKKAGRPWQPARDVVNAALWILRTDAPSADLPARYPSYQTAHRRDQRWVEGGVFEKILEGLADHLAACGKLDLTEGFIDGTHAGAKRGALWLASLDVARRPRSWQWQTAMVFLSPSGLRAVSALKSRSSKKRSTVPSSTSSLRT